MKQKDRMLKNQKGQGVMEYIIITSLVGIFCLVAVKQFGKTAKTRIDQMTNEIQEHIQIR